MDKEAMIQEIMDMISQLTDEQLEEVWGMIQETLDEIRHNKRTVNE